MSSYQEERQLHYYFKYYVSFMKIIIKVITKLNVLGLKKGAYETF